jgi:hypothetical protein
MYHDARSTKIMRNYITHLLVEQTHEVQMEATPKLTEIRMQNAPDLIGLHFTCQTSSRLRNILAAWIRHEFK